MKTRCKPAKLPPALWPRLSEIPGPVRPEICQNCDARKNLTYWQEHDACDRPEPILVVLCAECAKAMIGPHPRLYRQLGIHEPWPGLMPLCEGCTHRLAVRCLHPGNKLFAGERNSASLKITQPSPAHVLMSPRSQSGWIWIEAATDCSGRVEMVSIFEKEHDHER